MSQRRSKRVCPYCKSGAYSSLRDSKFCRACGKPVRQALGRWITIEDHSKIIGVVTAFTLYKRKRLGPNYEMSPPDERAEKVFAAQLLERCEWDYDIAIRAMTIKFETSRREVATLQWVIGRGFSDLLAKARQQSQQARRDNKQKQTVASIYEDRSDLFDDTADVDSTTGPKPGRTGGPGLPGLG